MEDVPQPAQEPYSQGDLVKVYLGEDDPDAEHHGRVCRIVERLDDNLDEETGRETDKYGYRLTDAETGEELPVQFRHPDLVPLEESA